jgi:molybdopterin converting factor small subunit
MNETKTPIALHIAIHGHCREFFPQAPDEFELRAAAGQNLRHILEALGIKPQLIMGMVVNGKLQKKDYLPMDGDRIVLLSPPTGG